MKAIPVRETEVNLEIDMIFEKLEKFKMSETFSDFSEKLEKIEFIHSCGEHQVFQKKRETLKFAEKILYCGTKDT